MFSGIILFQALLVHFVFVSSCLLVILVWYGNKKTQNVLPQQVLGFIWIRRPSKSWHTMSGSGRIWNWAEGWMLLEILLSTTARTLYASRFPFWALRYFFSSSKCYLIRGIAGDYTIHISAYAKIWMVATVQMLAVTGDVYSEAILLHAGSCNIT